MRFILSGTFIIYFIMVAYLIWEAGQVFEGKVHSYAAMAVTLAIGMSFPIFWVVRLRFGVVLSEKLGDLSVYIAAFLLYIVLFSLSARFVQMLAGSVLPLPEHKTAVLLVLALTLSVLIAGNYLATHTQVRTDSVDLAKGAGTYTARVVVFSDTHTGSSYYREDVARLVKLINAQKPDLILAAGDIIDALPATAKKQGIDAEFRKLTAPVYAVTGNHEYINGGRGCVEFLRECGFQVLLDEGREVLPRLYVFGRRDVQAARFGYRPLPLVLPNDKISIVLDHTPSRTKEEAQAGAKLIVSGHTHNGQLFPFNLVTHFMYPVSQGRGRVDDAEVLVSTGFGTWGPRVRTTCQSEIWVLNLKY